MTLFVKIDSWCVFVNTAGVTLIHSSMTTYVCVHVCVCRNKVHEDVTQHEILSDLFINGSEAFQRQAWISWPQRRQGLFLDLSLSPSISLSLSPRRFADYFCINHHDTGKATQFSAPVGKVRGVPKRWHEA